MSRQDLLMERFYREVVMQEQAELRKNVTTKLEAEVAALKKQIRDQELLHEKEKISLRWQQDDQVCRACCARVGHDWYCLDWRFRCFERI